MHDISIATASLVIYWNMLHLCNWFSIDIPLCVITPFVFFSQENFITREQLKWFGPIIIHLTLIFIFFILHKLHKTCPCMYVCVYKCLCICTVYEYMLMYLFMYMYCIWICICSCICLCIQHMHTTVQVRFLLFF